MGAAGLRNSAGKPPVRAQTGRIGEPILNSLRSERGQGYGLHKPEGRRRQDDDRDQPGGLPGPLRNIDPRHRHRPTGKCDQRTWDRPSNARPIGVRRAHRARAARTRSSWERRWMGWTCCPPRPRYPVPRWSWSRSPARERRLAASLAELNGRYDTRAHRLPALAGAADGERADGRGRGADPHPDRVLRAGGTEPAGEHDPPRPREPEPAAGDRGRAADHVRRAAPTSPPRWPPRCAAT